MLALWGRKFEGTLIQDFTVFVFIWMYQVIGPWLENRGSYKITLVCVYIHTYMRIRNGSYSKTVPTIFPKLGMKFFIFVDIFAYFLKTKTKKHPKWVIIKVFATLCKNSVYYISQYDLLIIWY